MNYRHAYHAGNFADVVKHTLLLAVLRGLQAKEKGLLCLDTHAGRGAYDLEQAARGARLNRIAEWPDGIGRVATAATRPEPVQAFWEAVGAFRQERSIADGPARVAQLYPGSPWLLRAALRPQDRLQLAEFHPEEAAALRTAFFGQRRVRVEETNGYLLIRAALPPLERRALVMIDPPFEALDEFAQVARALAEGLRRLPGGTFVVWYPLTERAGHEAFLADYARDHRTPAWTVELEVAGPQRELSLRGCGVLVVNPPWRLDTQLHETVAWFAEHLGQGAGARAALRWQVAERDA